ncbi:MAG: SsrA-binding protein SmpB [Desulfobacterales bacterium]|nr:SsrA-binding protein SmpB [Desulfobacterales bacterium]MDD3081746.1 SsrA-binding protein SmpB [Desulfobacterales bacterium]MDD3950784.1 SsrA-binding protein SmpB [Desulfobacterales bacterium]MDD4463243.1 SsrA-binding protein SmpB [Desulfobacterales bacterium]MDY0378211.1 SsrA-binding protein SmpB [Desulfobacterales bacterium]
MADKNWKLIAENRKARFDFFIEDQYEAGMVLVGTEVKSVRLGRVNLKDSYAKIVNGEVFVYQMHIGAYPFAYYDNHEPLRIRKLLLHSTEIRKLTAKLNEQGFTLIPLRVYIKDGKIKMTLGLARGKRKYDKRDTIRKRDQDRELRRVRKEL